jgi:hypothetical protein
MKIRLTITEQKGSATAQETLISERIIETESDKQLTGKRVSQILAREQPELGISARIVSKTPRGWMTSLATEPTEKCEYHYIWRHYFVTRAEE